MIGNDLNIQKNTTNQGYIDNDYGLNRKNSNISVNSRNKSRMIIDTNSMRKTENYKQTNQNKNQNEDLKKQEDEFDDIFEKHFNNSNLNLVEDKNDNKSFLKSSKVEDNINIKDMMNNKDDKMSS